VRPSQKKLEDEEYDDDRILTLNEPSFKAMIVYLILSSETERAIDILSRKFGVRKPALGIGHTKGKKIALAVYSVASNTISFADQQYFFDPFVVLHEMYHCVRSRSGNHRGTEKNADRFALDYIAEYNKLTKAVDRAKSLEKIESVHAKVD
jgi:hypothetical protein